MALISRAATVSFSFSRSFLFATFGLVLKTRKVCRCGIDGGKPVISEVHPIFCDNMSSYQVSQSQLISLSGPCQLDERNSITLEANDRLRLQEGVEIAYKRSLIINLYDDDD